MLKVKQLGRRLVSVIGAAAISLSLLSGINLTKPAEVKAATVSDLSANQITTNMGLGWNLGNSLESTGRGSSSNITDFETYWGNPVVTESLIKAVKAKGFSTIRIPVSWYEHVSYDNGNYTIDSKWLARVKQVVDYAYNNDMYVIINVHHENWINRSDFASSYSSMSAELKAIWKQIATYFSEYDQRLIFEGMNEPRAKGTSIEWSGNVDCYSVVNKLNADFVNTVRSVSSPYKNTRLLMIPDYAASCYSSVYSYLEIPQDDYVAVSIHAYSPYDFTMGSGDHSNFSSSYQSALDTIFAEMKSYFINKGIPVVIGEFSASNYNNTSARVAWAKYYMTLAKEAGIPCVLWDNNANTNGDSSEAHGYINRSTLQWYSGSEDVVNTLLAVMNNKKVEWGGETSQTGYDHSSIDVNSKYVIYSGSTYISGYCTDSFAINATQLSSGREIAVKYNGTGIPKLALVNSSWGNWKEASAYDVKDGIAYFSYEDIKKAWGDSTDSLKFVYVCGTGMTVTKIASLPEATEITEDQNTGSTGSDSTNQGTTGSESTGSGSTNQGTTGSESTDQNTQTGTTNSVAPITEGWYYIKNVNSQKYLQVKDNIGSDGQNVQINTGSGANGQKWYVKNSDNGYVTIKSATGYMLDVVNGQNTDGANINIWSANGYDPQKFKIVTSSVAGQYGILTKSSSDSKCLDVCGAKTADGTNVIQWTYGGRGNQLWVFEATSYEESSNSGNSGSSGNTGSAGSSSTGSTGNTGSSDSQGTTETKCYTVEMKDGKIDLSSYANKKVTGLKVTLSAVATGSGAAHLYTKSNGWIGSADYNFSNSNTYTVDLSKYNNIGNLNLYMWWNSANATITKVQVIVES